MITISAEGNRFNRVEIAIDSETPDYRWIRLLFVFSPQPNHGTSCRLPSRDKPKDAWVETLHHLIVAAKKNLAGTGIIEQVQWELVSNVIQAIFEYEWSKEE